ncbi:MAG: hypothetical protein ABI824_15930 [Acidobacteriota bacterium]
MYGKLFAQMFDGTLATKGPWEAMCTFQQFVILADKNGIVDMTPEAISRRTTIPLDVIKTGIAALLQPDAESRTPDEDGRRIVPISDHRTWGWQVVNYCKYSKIRTNDDRQEYMKDYMRNYRKGDHPPVNSVNNVDTSKQQLAPLAHLAHIDTDIDVDVVKTHGQKTTISSPPKARRRRVSVFASQDQADAFGVFWSKYWRRTARAAAETAYAKAATSPDLQAAIGSAIEAQSAEMTSRPPDKIPHAATWLNGRRWTDEVTTGSGTAKSAVERMIDAL